MNSKAIIVLFLLQICCSVKAQNLKATYEFRPSAIMSFSESVYVVDGNKISITDSVAIKKKDVDLKEDEFNTESFLVDNSNVLYRRVITQEIGSKNLLQTASSKNQNYLVSDKMPNIEWNINYTDSELIGKYTCKKATTNYRGSIITAYYSEEIPISTGPFKFGGLPGLILMAYSNGAHPNYWVISEIEYPFTGKIPVNNIYLNSLPKITLQEFVEKTDEESAEISKKFLSKMPAGMDGTIESTTMRGGVEQKYEWEK